MMAYIGLGSNLGCPSSQIQQAVRELSQLPSSCLVNCSRRYRNPPRLRPGQTKQPDYVNAVAVLNTRLSPIHLLRHLQAIEFRQGRTREEYWSPRTLDLDLLLYGTLRLQRRDLVVPHPRMHVRDFVLWPLRELAPMLVIPGRGRLSSIHLNSRKLQKIL